MLDFSFRIVIQGQPKSFFTFFSKIVKQNYLAFSFPFLAKLCSRWNLKLRYNTSYGLSFLKFKFLSNQVLPSIFNDSQIILQPKSWYGGHRLHPLIFLFHTTILNKLIFFKCSFSWFYFELVDSTEDDFPLNPFMDFTSFHISNPIPAWF